MSFPGELNRVPSVAHRPPTHTEPRSFPGTALLCCLCLTLMLAGCSKSEKPPPLVERGRLDLEIPRNPGVRPPGKVKPVFVPFAQLAQGIEAPVPLRLESPRHNLAEAEELFYPEQEPNNKAMTATPFVLPATLQGHIHPHPDSDSGDHDWYSFLVELDKPGVMEVAISGVPGVDVGIELYYDSVTGRTLLVSLDNESKAKGETLPNFRLTNGRYYLHVQQMARKKPRWNVLRPYRVTLRLTEEKAGNETEPNDSRLTAVPLAVPGKISGLVNRKKDQDWYSLDLLKLSSYSYMAVELLPPMDAGMELSVLTQSDEQLVSVATKDGRKLTIPNVALLPGATAYYVRVAALGEKVPAKPYTLEVRNEALVESCEVEPDNTPELAAKMVYEEPISGWLHGPEDVDWFRLEPVADWGTNEETGEPERPALNLVLAGVPGIDLVLETFDSDGETRLGIFDGGGKSAGEEVPNLAMPQRTVFLKVSSAKGFNANAQYILQARAVSTNGMEWEPNNSLGQASPVPPGTDKLMGYLSPAGDRDCMVLPPASRRVTVAAPGKAGIVVSAYSPAGALFFQQTVGDDEKVEVVGEDPGFSLCIRLESGYTKAPKSPYVLSFVEETGPESP